MAAAERATRDGDQATTQGALAGGLELGGPVADVRLALQRILRPMMARHAWEPGFALVGVLERATSESRIGKAGFERLLDWALQGPDVQVHIGLRVAERSDGLSVPEGRGSALLKRELRRRLGYVLEMMRESKTQPAVERLVELAPLLSQADAVWAQFCTEAYAPSTNPDAKRSARHCRRNTVRPSMTTR